MFLTILQYLIITVIIFVTGYLKTLADCTIFCTTLFYYHHHHHHHSGLFQT